MAGKGDKNRVTDFEAYRNSPLWENMGMKKDKFNSRWDVQTYLAFEESVQNPPTYYEIVWGPNAETVCKVSCAKLAEHVVKCHNGRL